MIELINRFFILLMPGIPVAGIRFWCYQPELSWPAPPVSSSSNNIRIDGVKSSSNWPERTAHRNTARKPPAITNPAAINTYIALINKHLVATGHFLTYIPLIPPQIYRQHRDYIMTSNRPKADICQETAAGNRLTRRQTGYSSKQKHIKHWQSSR